MITIVLSSCWMNIGVSKDNKLFADTNDSSNWRTLSVPLPDGKWRIVNQHDNHVKLKRVDNEVQEEAYSYTC